MENEINIHEVITELLQETEETCFSKFIEGLEESEMQMIDSSIEEYYDRTDIHAERI